MATNPVKRTTRDQNPAGFFFLQHNVVESVWCIFPVLIPSITVFPSHQHSQPAIAETRIILNICIISLDPEFVFNEFDWNVLNHPSLPWKNSLVTIIKKETAGKKFIKIQTYEIKDFLSFRIKENNATINATTKPIPNSENHNPPTSHPHSRWLFETCVARCRIKMIHPNMFPKVIKMESNVINGDLLFILLPFANHQDASKTIVFPTFNVQPESFAGNRASDGYILSL